jgi:DNA-binding NarL/FixJ family response regulator
MGSHSVRLLLVDDHTLFRQGIRLLLDRLDGYRVVGEASDGMEAVAKAHELMPDVVLMDIRMPRCSGLAALEQMQRELPSIRVVMLTISEDDDDLFTAIKGGAKGYVLKSSGEAELVFALDSVASGGAVVSPSMAVKLLSEFALISEAPVGELPANAPELTEREKEILELVGKGLENKEIADSLSVAESTVKNHLANIMAKLHIHNRTQAATYAVRCEMTAKRTRTKGQ